MATYTTEQLLTSILSTEFYSAETIDDAISALSGEIGDIVDSISVDINPRLSSIADAVSAHVQEINDLSTTVSGLTDLTALTSLTGDVNDISGDVEDLKAINAQLTAITTLPANGSIAISSIVAKVNEILSCFTKQA